MSIDLKLAGSKKADIIKGAKRADAIAKAE